MRRERRAWQYSLGEEFGPNPKIDEFSQKVLETLPNICEYEPLAMVRVTEKEEKSGAVSRLLVKSRDKERKIAILGDLSSFCEYCAANRVKGMIVIVPRLGIEGLGFEKENLLRDFFQGFGKMANPFGYRVWLVDREVGGWLTRPKSELERQKLAEKKEIIRQMGLAEVKYHHDLNKGLGWFEARPVKKREFKERDLGADQRILFMKQWMKMVVEYRGGRIIDPGELEARLGRGRSVLTCLEKVRDLRGVLSQEACGCLIYTGWDGTCEEVLACGSETCFKQADLRGKGRPFRLGEAVEISPCGDCGSERQAVPYWADIKSFDPQKGVRISLRITCPEFSSHCKKGYAWVNPARIVNPLYIFYVSRRRKK